VELVLSDYVNSFLKKKSDRIKLELICLHVVKRPNVEETTN